MTYFYRLFESNDGGGAGFDEDPISFGEAFGVNPDGSPYVAPEPTPDPPPVPTPDPEPTPPATPEPPDPTPPGENGAGNTPGDATPPAGETPDQVVERLYGGKYKTVEELEKAHKELTAAWDGRGPQAKPQATPEPEPPAEPPRPLFKGDLTEVANEEQLFRWVRTDPEAAAMFAMANSERMAQDTFDTVMDAWVAQQPFKAMARITEWNNQVLREEIAERQAAQDQAYMEQVADRGIDEALAEMPLMAEHQHDLGVFIEQNPQLEQMVAAARNPGELKNALQAIFYMMVGPQLAQQVLESQVAARVTEEQRAAAEAAAAAAAGKATTITRNSAPPPSNEQEYGDMIRDMVLNPSGKKSA